MRINWLLVVAIVAGLVLGGVALSESWSPPATTAADPVKTISKREWNRMKGRWAKETDKWASCNKQADDQKLSGRNSWSFIAGCMSS